MIPRVQAPTHACTQQLATQGAGGAALVPPGAAAKPRLHAVPKKRRDDAPVARAAAIQCRLCRRRDRPHAADGSISTGAAPRGCSTAAALHQPHTCGRLAPMPLASHAVLRLSDVGHWRC
eukprot:365019-Chlamydomonas_euryale.AAC.14